jgi:hypothetical protein
MPINLQLKQCEVLPEAKKFPNPSAMEELEVKQQKSLGVSGDLQIIDSPGANGSPGNGLSNRMAGLTSTQKQFIHRVDFDKNLQEVFARKLH